MIVENINQEALAKELNISVGTVSKSLRDYPDVSPKTKARVLELARKLGYRPYLSGYEQSSSKTEMRLIGVLTQTPHQPCYSQIDYLSGMSEISGELNVSQVVHNCPVDKCGDILIPSLQPSVMRDGLISGLIFIHRWPRDIVLALSKKYHCVSIVHDYTDLGVSYVGIDNSGLISMLFDKLYDLGHNEIGFMGKCSELSWSMAGFGGYCQSMAKHGFDIDNANIFDVDVRLLEDKSYDWEEYFDFDQIARRIDSGVRAWMCSADWCAYNLFAALKRRGYDVPGDVSITGSDSNEKTRLGCSNVTGVNVDSRQLGRSALRLLCDLLDKKDSGCSKIIHKCEFFEGTTIQPPVAVTV